MPSATLPVNTRLPVGFEASAAARYRVLAAWKARAPAAESPAIHASGTIHSARPSGWGSKYSVTGTQGQFRSVKSWLGPVRMQPGFIMVTTSAFKPPSPPTSRTLVESAHASTRASRKYCSDVPPRQAPRLSLASSKWTWVVLVVSIPRSGEIKTCATSRQGLGRAWRSIGV